MSVLPSLDAKDLVYLVCGLAFLGYALLPMFCSLRLISVPTLYVAAGCLGVLLGVPLLDPAEGGVALDLIEHATELIVIISIAGAGLAVDRRMGPRAWRHTWVLLGVTMPLTVLAMTGLGLWAGLLLPAAVLLGACLSPTDPVLARSVKVDGPNSGEEHDVKVSLTTEAGLNDGLAFPLVYLAVALAAVSGVDGGEGDKAWFWSWLWFDVGYRVAAGVGLGWGCGYVLAQLVYHRKGDAGRGGENAGLVLLASVFLSYGLAEAVEGYGFLAVFVCARAGRHFARDVEHERYAELPHHFSDQFEKILLALLLLWFGGYVVGGGLVGLTWREAGIAAALVFLVRPLAGYLALWPTVGSRLDHAAIALLGIRGFGSIFYLAYAQTHGSWDDLTPLWRIVTLSILISIVIHGVAAPLLIGRLHDTASPWEPPSSIPGR